MAKTQGAQPQSPDPQINSAPRLLNLQPLLLPHAPRWQDQQPHHHNRLRRRRTDSKIEPQTDSETKPQTEPQTDFKIEHQIVHAVSVSGRRRPHLHFVCVSSEVLVVVVEKRKESKVERERKKRKERERKAGREKKKKN